VTTTKEPLRASTAVVERRMTGRQRVLVLHDLLQHPARVDISNRWCRLA
jgi:hypothetical protein